MKIVILATGGTIAGLAADAADNIGYAAGQVGVEALARAVKPPSGCTLEAEQVAQLDSKDMDAATWLRLARRTAHHLARADVAGIVVTHGTDTLEETAYFLHRLLAPAKPVVLTGAMRPASSLQADGPRNLADAVAVAAAPGARGVVVVFAGRIHGAADVRKVHPYRLDAFDSAEAGVLGVVEEGVLRCFRDWPRGEAIGLGRFDAGHRAVADGNADAAAPDDDDDSDRAGPVDNAGHAGVAAALAWPRVEIVVSHAGADGAIVRDLCASGTPPRGIVVAATGNGTVHRELAAALFEARAHGVLVLRALRHAGGHSVGSALPRARGLGTEAEFESLPLTPTAARVEAILRLRTRPLSA